MNIDNAVVYIVSDSIGETGEQVAKAAIAQYGQCDIKIRRKSNIADKESIEEIINEAQNFDSIIMFTLVLPDLRDYILQLSAERGIPCVDIMTPALDAITNVVKQQPSHTPGILRQLNEAYFNKVEAMEFAVKYDDCKDTRGIKMADIVLLGVSRTSKTPLSMYLATKNLKVTNIPLLPEVKPPKELYEISPKKIIGLITSPGKLNAIRIERLKAHGLSSDANYANLARIDQELKYAEEIMRGIGCTVIDVTNKAIEETAGTILQIFKEVH
jgi:regulator of PEP synthase PpsR (kinase-PPPase family)